MDDLLDRLASVNPVPECEPLPIDAIWERSSRKRARPNLVLLPIAAAVPVLVAVLVVVLVAAHHRVAIVSAPTRTACDLTQPSGPGGPAARIVRISDPGIAALIAELRRPAGPQDSGPAACMAKRIAVQAMLPQNPRYAIGADPSSVRDAGPGLLGGEVFLYLQAATPRSVAYHGMPANSGLAHSETQPKACLVTVDAAPQASGQVCDPVFLLTHPPQGLSASQLPNSNQSIMFGIVPDGIAAVAVSDHGRRVMTVPVRNNVVQFIVNHSPPAAVYMKITYLNADGRPVHPQ